MNDRESSGYELLKPDFTLPQLTSTIIKASEAEQAAVT